MQSEITSHNSLPPAEGGATHNEHSAHSAPLEEGLGHVAIKLNESTKDQKMAQAEQWLNSQDMFGQPIESVPSDVASEVALLARKRISVLQEDGFVDEESLALESVLNHALESAQTLDFELVRISRDNWPLLEQMNAMHGKFEHVSAEALSNYLGNDDASYEHRALFIRSIIADHAPALLTENLRVMDDVSQPMWRRASAQASILLKSRVNKNMHGVEVNKIPTSLPAGKKMEYGSEDDQALKSLSDMNDEELALYVQHDAMAAVRERGHALFNELNVPARETLLTHKIFESVGKSHDQTTKDLASERNKAHEHDPMLQEGDLVHATSSYEVFDAILTDGLRCGEGVMGNDRPLIKYPFSVSLLEVSGKVAGPESPIEKFSLLKNDAYGAINLVMSGNVIADDYVKGQPAGVVNQRQIFGGAPSTALEKIIIREHDGMAQTIEKVTRSIVEHGMFLPVYNGKTGELLLTANRFDELRTRVS